MKEQINGILQGAWCSVYSGVNIDKATDDIYNFVVENLDNVTDSCERQLEVVNAENRRLEDAADYWQEEAEDLKEQLDELRDEIKELNEQLDDESSDSDACEVNLGYSQELLQEVLPELNRLLEINSNNPNKYRELNLLMYKVEEQIIKNGK